MQTTQARGAEPELFQTELEDPPTLDDGTNTQDDEAVLKQAAMISDAINKRGGRTDKTSDKWHAVKGKGRAEGGAKARARAKARAKLRSKLSPRPKLIPRPRPKQEA